MKVKNLIILAIILFAVILLGATSVQATSIPRTMYVFGFTNATDIATTTADKAGIFIDGAETAPAILKKDFSAIEIKELVKGESYYLWDTDVYNKIENCTLNVNGVTFGTLEQTETKLYANVEGDGEICAYILTIDENAILPTESSNGKYSISTSIDGWTLLISSETKLITVEELLANIPETIEVGMSTVDAIQDGHMSTALINLLEEKLSAYESNEMQIVYAFVGEKLYDMSEIKVSLYDSDSQTNLLAEKTVTLKFTDNWNATDKKYVESKCSNISLNLNNSLMIDFSETRTCKELIEDGFEKLINDSTIQCTFYPAHGDWFFPQFHMQGIVAFTKNNVIYFTASTEVIGATGTMIIPNDIEDTEEAFMEYALSKLKTMEEYADVELYMEKGEDAENQYFVYLGSKDPTLILLNKNKEVVSTNKETNIRLDSTESVVPSNTVLEVTPIKEGTAYNTIKYTLSDMEKFVAYDITLTSNNVEIQPNGKLKISIPIPEGFDTSNLAVFRVEADGDRIEYSVKAVTIDGVKYAQFETDHFSYYVLAEKQSEGAKDNTPNMGVTENFVVITTLLTVISAGAVVSIRRMK